MVLVNKVTLNWM